MSKTDTGLTIADLPRLLADEGLPLPRLLADEDPANLTIASPDGEKLPLRFHEPYWAVVSRFVRHDTLAPRIQRLEQHRKTLRDLHCDQEQRLLVGSEELLAVLTLKQKDADLGSKLLAELLATTRTVDVRDLDEAATHIRAYYLSLGVPEEDYNRLIADQIRQQIEWIDEHRAEIDEKNPKYQDQPLRPSANWIAALVGVPNKRVERVYHREEFGLREVARRASYGSDGRVQAGKGAGRGRRKANSNSKPAEVPLPEDPPSQTVPADDTAENPVDAENRADQKTASPVRWETTSVSRPADYPLPQPQAIGEGEPEGEVPPEPLGDEVKLRVWQRFATKWAIAFTESSHCRRLANTTRTAPAMCFGKRQANTTTGRGQGRLTLPAAPIADRRRLRDQQP